MATIETKKASILGLTERDTYLSYFTPSQMTHAALEAILVGRQKLAERLTARIRESVLTPTKHHSLLLGPRGIGKSYLIALIYHRIKAMPDVAIQAALAWLSEEEWSVASLGDFYVVILRALEREYGGLKEGIADLYRLPDDTFERAAGDLLRETVGARTLVLLAENLEEIFRGLTDAEQWALRSFLSERPFATILATTPSLFAGISRQKSAFYGYFAPTYLEELTLDEATELLRKVAVLRGDDDLAAFLTTDIARDRVEVVHRLAGGHPRIYLLFAHLLTSEALDELVTPFLKLLDELTPYYQSRMQLLSPQQRKIVEFLSEYGGAAPVKTIAARNRMTQQTASSQLKKLDEMAYVRRHPLGRDSYYELREPLLRLVLEVKRGREEPIRIIVDFLRLWYSRNERKEWLAETELRYQMTREYLEASLDLERARFDPPNDAQVRELLAEFKRCKEQGNPISGCELIEEVIERHGRESEPWEWYEYIGCCIAIDDIVKARKIWDKAKQRFPNQLPHFFLGKALEETVDSLNLAVWHARSFYMLQWRQWNVFLAGLDEFLSLQPERLHGVGILCCGILSRKTTYEAIKLQEVIIMR